MRYPNSTTNGSKAAAISHLTSWPDPARRSLSSTDKSTDHDTTSTTPALTA
jgi:hypothetical protein